MTELNFFSRNKCCEFPGKLTENEFIYCIGGTRNDIFVGTDQGRLLRFLLHEERYRLTESRQFPSKRSITAIEISTALNDLFVICGSDFYTVSLDDFKITPTLAEVSRLAINVNPMTEDPFAIPTAFALGRKGISIVEVTDRGVKKKYQIDTSMPVRGLAYSRNTICYVLEHHYLALNVANRQVIRLFQHDCPTPSIVPVGPDEFLVRSSAGLSIFVHGDGTSTRPPCVLSTLKGPLFFREPYIINCDRTKVAVQDCHTQHLEEFSFDHINAANYIEGQLFIVNKGSELHTIGETPKEVTVCALIEMKQYSQAVDLLERSLSGKNDKELIQKLAECAEKSAIEEIKQGHFDLAAEHLLKCTMSIAEVLEKLQKQQEDLGENYSPFVKHLLLIVRSDMDFSSQKELIDYELLRIFYQMKCQSELDDLVDFTPEPLGAADIFARNNEERRAAELLFDTHHYKEAIPMFIRVGIVYDASHLRPLMFKLRRIPYSSEMMAFYSLLAPYFPVEVMELLSLNQSSLNEVQYILRGLSTWDTYLEKQPMSEIVAVELCILYISAIEDEDDGRRRKLRHVLFSADDQALEKISIFLGSEKFKLEKLICEAKNDPGAVLDKLLEVNDFESAELLSRRFAKSHPNVAMRLLNEYLEDKKHAAAAGRIGSLLAQVGSNFNSEELLSKLPNDLKINELTSFLKSSVISSVEEQIINQLQLAASEKCIERPSDSKIKNNVLVQLNDHSQCPVCHSALTYGEPLTILPTCFIVHSKCYKHPHLCPVTNVLF